MDVFEPAEFTVDVEVCGNVAKRRVLLKGHQILPAHKHNFAHAHALVRGTIRLVMHYEDGRVEERTYTAPAFFEVPADCGHQLESITDEGAEGWCLFAVRDEDGGVTYEPTEANKRDRFWHERRGGGA